MEGMIEAVAESMAYIDRELDGFLRERGIGDPVKAMHENPEFKGTYVGYMADAAELIRQVEARGYRFIPASSVKNDVPSEKPHLKEEASGSRQSREAGSVEGELTMGGNLQPSVEIASLKKEVQGLHMRIGDLLAGVSGLYRPTSAMLLAGDAAMDKAGRWNVSAGDVWLAMFSQAMTDHLDRAVERCFGEAGENPAEVILSPEDDHGRSLMLASLLAEAIRERDALKLKVGHLEQQKAITDQWLSESIVISTERFGSLIDTEKASGRNPDDEEQRWDPERGWVPPLGPGQNHGRGM